MNNNVIVIFKEIIPIINFEHINLKRRIAFNIGISRKYDLDYFSITIFFKQQIPLKNFYYHINSSSDNLELIGNSKYGGAKIGLNILFK